MSSQTERQHAEYFKYQLKRHLRETMEAFGETIEAQAEDCREELAMALAETGYHLTSSVPMLRRRLREHAGRLETGAARATASLGRDLSSAGQGMSRRQTARGPAVVSAETSVHRVPGSRVAVTKTIRGMGFVPPAEDQEPESAIPPEGRDSHAA